MLFKLILVDVILSIIFYATHNTMLGSVFGLILLMCILVTVLVVKTKIDSYDNY